MSDFCMLRLDLGKCIWTKDSWNFFPYGPITLILEPVQAPAMCVNFVEMLVQQIQSFVVQGAPAENV